VKEIPLQGKTSVEEINPKKQMNPRKKVNKDKIKIHYWEMSVPHRGDKLQLLLPHCTASTTRLILEEILRDMI
jgi:hypothetical protein